jgi:hypothetical protein
MCWSPKLGVFVASGYNTTNYVTSEDGEIWTARTAPHSLSCVCWSPELELFSTLDYDVKWAMTSIDGINWVSNDITALAVSNHQGMCWSPELGVFCAVNYSGVAFTVKSVDGLNWTKHAVTKRRYGGVAWSPSLGLFCACASGSGNSKYFITSEDGETWNDVEVDPSYASAYGITWSPGLGLFCAVGDDSAPDDKSWTSPDGINWTEQQRSTGVACGRVVWSPELETFCTIGDSKSELLNETSINEFNPLGLLYETPATKETLIHQILLYNDNTTNERVSVEVAVNDIGYTIYVKDIPPKETVKVELPSEGLILSEGDSIKACTETVEMVTCLVSGTEEDSDEICMMVYNDTNSDSGVPPVDINGYSVGDTITLQGASTLSKTGYTAEWNTQSDGKGTSYALSSSYVIHTGYNMLYIKRTLTP